MFDSKENNKFDLGVKGLMVGAGRRDNKKVYNLQV